MSKRYRGDSSVKNAIRDNSVSLSADNERL